VKWLLGVRERTIYKLSLLLSLIVSLTCFGLDSLNLPLPGWLGSLIATTYAAAVVGCLPYLIIMALILWWVRGKTDTQFRRTLILSPLLMLPIFWFLMLAFGLVVGERPGRQAFKFLVFFYSPFILAYGYAYVAIVLILLFLLRRVGFVSLAGAT
jgi:Uncharacterized conserved protein